MIDKNISTLLKSWCEAMKQGFDIRDIFVFGGLVLLGYGLYLFKPWISFSVTGTFLISLGLFFGRIKK